MGLIALEGMEFYAYHGFYKEEQLIGGDYIVDVYVHTDFTKGASEDLLDGTVNYETIFRIVKVEMNKKSKLLESIAQRIVDSIINICTSIQSIKVKITKKNPPLGAKVDKASVEIEENYVIHCNKCKNIFLSHQKGDCWTKYGIVYPETKATLIRTFGPNICKNCLSPHFVKERN
ncbi:MAG: dihydroneopterin aldolase [Saprospiraceae bacterium]|nr:dihydroneopterin aldolase [Saprospiraceae bacterium]